MLCQNCGAENEDTHKFCLKCGRPLSMKAPEATPMEKVTPGEIVLQPPQASPTPPQPLPSKIDLEPSASKVRISQPEAEKYPRPQKTQPFGTQSLGILKMWGPFAGYGTRRSHRGWLMNGQGDRCNDLISSVESKFKKREIPGASLARPTLIARGVVVERRPYFVLRRGLVTLALYIAQFGRDLFVSMASYLKPPISNFRVLVFSFMVLFGLYTVFVFPSALANSLESIFGSVGLLSNAEPNVGGFFSLLCLIGPLGTINNIALLLFFCYGAYKWLKEKDFWAGLRVSPNEFNEDDLMAMEKAVEETVRQSLTDLKLNPDDLLPVSQGRGGQLF